MCLAIQEIREESRLEGEKKGENIGAITFAKELGISRSEKVVYGRILKSDEEAEEHFNILVYSRNVE